MRARIICFGNSTAINIESFILQTPRSIGKQFNVYIPFRMYLVNDENRFFVSMAFLRILSYIYHEDKLSH